MELFKNNRWLLIPILSSLLLLVLMKTVLFLGYVPTESMEPTLKKVTVDNNSAGMRFCIPALCIRKGIL